MWRKREEIVQTEEDIFGLIEDTELQLELNLPENYKAYSLYVQSGAESADCFFDISVSIIKRLMESCFLVLRVVSDEDTMCNTGSQRGKQCQYKRCFLADYYEVLKAHGISAYFWLKPRAEMIIESVGADIPVLSLLKNRHDLGYSFDVVAYVKPPKIGSFKEGAALFLEHDYAVQIRYEKQPDNLAVIINTDVLTPKEAIEAVRQILHKSEKRLDIDIQGWE